jgi:hypothetical protein
LGDLSQNTGHPGSTLWSAGIKISMLQTLLSTLSTSALCRSRSRSSCPPSCTQTTGDAWGQFDETFSAEIYG